MSLVLSSAIGIVSLGPCTSCVYFCGPHGQSPLISWRYYPFCVQNVSKKGTETGAMVANTEVWSPLGGEKVDICHVPN